MELPLLNSKFESNGTYKCNIALDGETVNKASVHQVVKSLLAGRRQGNACTKNKALVQGGGKKPFKQKGTGRARQGSTRSPLMVGGGTIFGPQPRSFDQKINKKLKLKAIHSILADKFQAGKLIVLSNIESSGKTKDLHKVLDGKNLLPGLVVTDSKDSLALRAVKNIKNAKGLAVEGFSVYEAVKYENLIIEKAALEKLLTRLG